MKLYVRKSVYVPRLRGRGSSRGSILPFVSLIENQREDGYNIQYVVLDESRRLSNGSTADETFGKIGRHTGTSVLCKSSDFACVSAVLTGYLRLNKRDFEKMRGPSISYLEVYDEVLYIDNRPVRYADGTRELQSPLQEEIRRRAQI